MRKILARLMMSLVVVATFFVFVHHDAQASVSVVNSTTLYFDGAPWIYVSATSTPYMQYDQSIFNDNWSVYQVGSINNSGNLNVSAPLGSGRYYFLIKYSNSGSGLPLDNGFGGQVVYFNGTDFDLFDNTRFISVIPDYASTTATTTVVGATGYVSDDDYVSGAYLEIKLENPTLSATGGSVLDAWNSSFGVATTLPILSSGYFTATTSYTFDFIGRYNVQYKVRVPNTTSIIGSLFPTDILVATSSYFVVSTSTWFDDRAEDGYQGIVDVLLTGTTTIPILDCNFTGFDLQRCLISLVIPNSAILQSDLELLRDGFLTSFPVGYVTRFIDIVGSNATTALPSISMPIIGTNQVLDLTPWEFLFGDDSILSQASSTIVYEGTTYGSGDSLRDIIETYWNWLWYILLGFAIIHDVIGFGKHNMKKKI